MLWHMHALNENDRLRTEGVSEMDLVLGSVQSHWTGLLDSVIQYSPAEVIGKHAIVFAIFSVVSTFLQD